MREPMTERHSFALLVVQPETDLDSYQFSVPNLHETIENLLAIERARQEEELAKEQQRLEQEKLKENDWSRASRSEEKPRE